LILEEEKVNTEHSPIWWALRDYKIKQSDGSQHIIKLKIINMVTGSRGWNPSV